MAEVRSFLGAWPGGYPTPDWEVAASAFRTVPSEQSINGGQCGASRALSAVLRQCSTGSGAKAGDRPIRFPLALDRS